jgi:starvation-inducible DNA-binding protein
VVSYTIPGMKTSRADKVIALLQDRLDSLSDLALTLKDVHWNVIGPNFIAVRTMLDPQVDAVRVMADETAERIAALGGSPSGTPARSSSGATGTTTPSGGPTPSSTSAR